MDWFFGIGKDLLTNKPSSDGVTPRSCEQGGDEKSHSTRNEGTSLV